MNKNEILASMRIAYWIRDVAVTRLVLQWSDIHVYSSSCVETYIPSSPGVYQLLCKKDVTYLVFYVGQADNLNKRLKDHLSGIEPSSCIRSNLWYYPCFFLFAVLEAQSDRDCAERALYDHYRPPCNIVPPPGVPCDINFK